MFGLAVLLGWSLCLCVVDAGLLKVGTPLPWNQALPYLSYVREHGVLQFLFTYQEVKHIKNNELLWGDEVEYSLIKVDHKQKKVSLALRAPDLQAKLKKREQQHSYRCDGCTWHAEYGSWMLEGTPSRPFRGFTTDLLRVERNMRLRRARLLATVDADEIAPTMTNFPLFGVGAFTTPAAPAGGEASESIYVPDAAINPHPRFAALTANIRSRRQAKVQIEVPLYRDVNTPEFLQQDAAGAPPVIDMDCMAFGMGCCCLQLTFQAQDVDESTHLYDQLAVLSPLMLALSAATPIFRGRLADTDVRWDVISASVDDRTPAERGQLTQEEVEAAKDPRLAGGGVVRQIKSRYASISTFINECKGGRNKGRVLDKYNDIDCPVDEASRKLLLQAGVREGLARHIAHLFSRDPLVIFEGRVDEVNDAKEQEHFDNLQSTNWQTVRWKPPPRRTGANDPHIGWRTEFRSLEIQLSDFENAAYAVFIVLVTRVILAFDLNLYVPLSRVDENMDRAHRRDAVLNEKFYFRANIDPPPDMDGLDPEQDTAPCCADENDEVVEMTMLEVLTGSGGEEGYPGLLPLVRAYLDYIKADQATVARVEMYLEHLRARAAGEIMTTAAWMRQFVTQHADYKQDSVVTDEIAYDLVMACKEIGEGIRPCPELLGQVTIEAVNAEEAFDVPMTVGKIGADSRNMLIRRYGQRGRQPSEASRAFAQVSVSQSVEVSQEERNDLGHYTISLSYC
ncbi:unnamed protein product [Chrysoparadoxa australica]